MSATARVQQWATFARQWHIFDCKWQNPFDSAEILVKYLKGKFNLFFGKKK
jgi:large subunit ribosomal protein L13